MLLFYLSAVYPETDKDKLKYIYDNYYAYMSFKASQVLSDERDIDDVVQSAIVSIIENFNLIDFTDDRKVKVLCGVIAKHKAIDHCRKKDNQTVSINTSALNIPDNESDPEYCTIKHEAYELVVKTIMSMSDIYKNVCYLKYINGLTEREIADTLGITQQAVKSRIFRGKQILRDVLIKEGYYEQPTK